jgi:hypothetical protein
VTLRLGNECVIPVGAYYGPAAGAAIGPVLEYIGPTIRQEMNKGNIAGTLGKILQKLTKAGANCLPVVAVVPPTATITRWHIGSADALHDAVNCLG